MEDNKGSVLIVDDTPENLKVLTGMLNRHGYQVHPAMSGQAALNAVQRIHPDLILLDVMMPGMDGYDVCRRLKEQSETRDIPVIFITFLSGIEDKLKGFEVGGIDYITKPFQYQEVLARVQTHLTNRKLLQQLQEEHVRFQVLADAGFEGIIIHDVDAILEVNQTIVEILGDQRTALIGKDPLVFVAEECRDMAVQQMHAADGQPYVLEGKDHSGKQLFLELRVKPILWQGREVLVSAIRDITQRMALEHENLTLRTTLNTREKFGEMVGKTIAMRKVYERIVLAAASDETIMIYGETGTGKELAARMIFTLSKQHTREFVVVNCAALQESLFESQFFGYRKGAFTGAERDTPGHFDQAAGGALFLDEVGELTISMQSKLLRVLENKTYMPVGATTSRTADVRIIAATNHDLRKLKGLGKIRDDFFHRLHVIALEIPPLRHRKEDIPLLIRHFLTQYPTSDKLHRKIPAAVIEQFCAYDWPGNIRELFNELRRYLTTGEIELNDYRPPVAEMLQKVAISSNSGALQEVLDAVEKQFIAKALEQSGGNKVKAAEMLQFPLRSLHRKIKKYQLK